jgi:hypothetical protein
VEFGLLDNIESFSPTDLYLSETINQDKQLVSKTSNYAREKQSLRLHYSNYEASLSQNNNGQCLKVSRQWN